VIASGFYGGVAAKEAGDVRGDDLYSDARELTDVCESSEVRDAMDSGNPHCSARA
jgi:hypothetical protein